MALSVKVTVPKITKTHAGAVAVGLSAVVLIAGCGGGGDSAAKKPSAPATTSASPSAGPEQEAREQVLAAYRGMWREQVKIYGSGSLKGSELAKYAADKALAKVRAAAIYYQDNSLVVKGEPQLSPKVTAIALSTEPKTATVVDCVDSSKFVPENSKTGKKSQLDGGNRRHLQTSKAQYGSGKWLITDATIDRKSTC
ncbi:hypothetical protein [Streptomyces sp. NPDC002402]